MEECVCATPMPSDTNIQGTCPVSGTHSYIADAVERILPTSIVDLTEYVCLRRSAASKRSGLKPPDPPRELTLKIRYGPGRGGE